MDDPPPKFEELLEDAKECQKMKKDEFTFRDDQDMEVTRNESSKVNQSQYPIVTNFKRAIN